MSDRIRSEDGLTLMEVIIVILIFGIVASFIFRFMDFSLSGFTQGSDHAENIANLRLTAYRITDEVRNVRNINLLSTPDTTDPDALDEYIWLDGAELKHSVISSGTSVRISDDRIQSVSYSLALENDQYILTINLDGQDGQSLSTEVLLNNMAAGAPSVDNTSGSVIEFDFDVP